MIRWFLRKRLDAVERRLGASMDYLRHMLDVSLPALLRFMLILPLAGFRKKTPADAMNVARIIASREEDCGACLQIAVNVARSEGLATDHIRAILDNRSRDLPDHLAAVHDFTLAVIRRDNPDEDSLRNKMRELFGEPALVELSLAIASARVFPTLKRGMGYAVSCSLTRIEI